VVLLAIRLIGRGTLLIALATGAYVAVEIVTYLQAYPDAASRARLASFQDNAAVRMLQGVPHAVDTVGGFVAWDAGWVLASIIGLWALLTTSRLLRREEETGRTELILAAQITAARATRLQLTVLGAAVCIPGAFAALALAVSGTGSTGALVFGLGLAGFAGTFAALAAVASQVFEVPRRATSAAAAVFGACFLLRMVANSSDARQALRWATPFGWLDNLHPYPGPDWTALIPLLAAPVVLGTLAVWLSTLRDTGAGLLTEPDTRAPRLWLLRSPAAFAWRGARGMLTGWVMGISAYALVMGMTAKAITDFAVSDPSYRKVLQAMGLDLNQATKGYLAFMGALLGLLLSLHACWQIGAARTEEATGRLEHTLTRPVTRTRWLGAHALVATASTVAITLVASLALWTGTAATGADTGVGDAFAALANTLPLTLLFAGLAVLVYGVGPRHSLATAVTVTVTAYLVQMIGPALDWPRWLLDITPFHHLAQVPAQPFAPVSATVMTFIGVASLVGGLVAFSKRDLTGD
jgi:ABC-2 type transport system permease protein